MERGDTSSRRALLGPRRVPARALGQAPARPPCGSRRRRLHADGRTSVPGWGERPTTERPAKKPPTDELTPTRKLLKDIIDAGGIVEIDTRDDKTSYRSLVGIINRRMMAPDGQEVIMLNGAHYHHLIFRLSSV